MAFLVSADNPLEGWAKSTIEIAKHGDKCDQLLVTIDRPLNVEPSWLVDYCPRKLDASVGSLRSVVRVLAPDALEMRGVSRVQKYNAAWAWFDKARRQNVRLSNWKSTYFERLTRLESGTNQIEEIILKMNRWPQKRVAAFYAHTTNIDMDHLTPQGNPCLQYIQFLQRANQPLDMFALYRNHDFFEKSLGNYIGLARLLGFVCRETEQIPGKLICLSVHAYLRKKRSILPMARALLN